MNVFSYSNFSLASVLISVNSISSFFLNASKLMLRTPQKKRKMVKILDRLLYILQIFIFLFVK